MWLLLPCQELKHETVGQLLALSSLTIAPGGSLASGIYVFPVNLKAQGVCFYSRCPEISALPFGLVVWDTCMSNSPGAPAVIMVDLSVSLHQIA